MGFYDVQGLALRVVHDHGLAAIELPPDVRHLLVERPFDRAIVGSFPRHECFGHAAEDVGVETCMRHEHAVLLAERAGSAAHDPRSSSQRRGVAMAAGGHEAGTTSSGLRP